MRVQVGQLALATCVAAAIGLWIVEGTRREVTPAPLPGAAAPRASAGEASPARVVDVAGPDGNQAGGAAERAEVRTAEVAAAEAQPPIESPAPPLASDGLHVRVVDTEGRPQAAVSVALEMRVIGFGEDVQARATTRAPDGLARLALDGVAELRGRAPGIAVGFAVRADVASAVPARVHLDGWPRDGDLVELRLPPSGSVRVRVRTRDGAPCPSGTRVGWWWVPAEVAAADPACAYDRVADHLIAVENGVAWIEGVGLDVALQLSATAPGLGEATVRGVAGPRSPGEVLDVELLLGPAMTELRLRVLDTGGRPLAETPLHAELWRDPDAVAAPGARPVRPSWFVLTTDGAGVARFTLAPTRFDGAPRLDVTRRSRDRDASRDEHWSSGSVALPMELAEGGAVDLGDVALTPVPVLCEGVVVDPEGTPVAGAALWFSGRPTPEHEWSPLADARITADADGRFLLRGARAPGHLAVDVSAKGFPSVSRHELEVGATSVRLVLHPAPAEELSGAVRLLVELEPDVSPLALLLQVRTQEGGGRTPDWWAGHEMEVGGLAPGAYDVSLETRRGRLELVRVRGVRVEAGQVTADPRLLPLDARGLARTVELECVAPDGSPWRRRKLRVAPGDPRAAFEVTTDDEGTVALTLPSVALTVIIALDRDRTTRLGLGPADRRARVVLAGG